MQASNRSKALALACVAALALPALTEAQEVDLKFATLSPPQSHLAKQMMVPWAERVNAAGKGAVRVQVVYGETLATQQNVYSRVLNDVVQIGWGLQTYFGGKFPLTDVVTLPSLAQSSEQASLALWRMYASGKLAGEYAEVMPLALIVFPQQSIHARRPVAKLEDLKGMKIRAAGKVASQSVSALGAVPVSLTVSDMYQALAKGTVDATMTQWTAFQPFKLDEVTSHHVEAPLGSAAAMVFMSKKKWQDLPPAARDVLSRESGESFSRDWGRFWDRVQKQGRDSVAASPKHTIHVLPAEEERRWEAALAKVSEGWVKDTPGGAAILQTFRDELRKAAVQ